MPTAAEWQKVRAEASDLKDRLDAHEQTAKLLEANLTLGIDLAKSLVRDGKDTLVRLSKVEGQLRSHDHDRAEIRHSLGLLLDFMDRIEKTAGLA